MLAVNMDSGLIRLGHWHSRHTAEPKLVDCTESCLSDVMPYRLLQGCIKHVLHIPCCDWVAFSCFTGGSVQCEDIISRSDLENSIHGIVDVCCVHYRSISSDSFQGSFIHDVG